MLLEEPELGKGQWPLLTAGLRMSNLRQVSVSGSLFPRP